MIEDFGIVVACCDQDYLFAKACCASIRNFMGEVPICLIADGTFSVRPLEKTYNVHVINQDTVSHRILRERSFGFGLTKMIAFWESPWKHFLYLDADTNVWGNILKFANFSDFDFIIDKPRYKFSDQDIADYFFDIQGIEKYFPDFRWQEHRHHYFCTGVFFATKNLFTIDEYIHILDLVSLNPKLFFPGEQGFLNLMICRAADEGRIRLGQETIQLLVPDFDRESLRKRFPVNETESVHQGEDVVIHWCGRKKPTSGTSAVYSEPMTLNRQKFIHDTWGYTGFRADILLKTEDFAHYLYSYKNKFRRKLPTFFSRHL